MSAPHVMASGDDVGFDEVEHCQLFHLICIFMIHLISSDSKTGCASCV